MPYSCTTFPSEAGEQITLDWPQRSRVVFQPNAPLSVRPSQKATRAGWSGPWALRTRGGQRVKESRGEKGVKGVTYLVSVTMSSARITTGISIRGKLFPSGGAMRGSTRGRRVSAIFFFFYRVEPSPLKK